MGPFLKIGVRGAQYSKLKMINLNWFSAVYIRVYRMCDLPAGKKVTDLPLSYRLGWILNYCFLRKEFCVENILLIVCCCSCTLISFRTTVLHNPFNLVNSLFSKCL